MWLHKVKPKIFSTNTIHSPAFMVGYDVNQCQRSDSQAVIFDSSSFTSLQAVNIFFRWKLIDMAANEIRFILLIFCKLASKNSINSSNGNSHDSDCNATVTAAAVITCERTGRRKCKWKSRRQWITNTMWSHINTSN